MVDRFCASFGTFYKNIKTTSEESARTRGNVDESKNNDGIDDLMQWMMLFTLNYSQIVEMTTFRVGFKRIKEKKPRRTKEKHKVVKSE